MKNILKIYIFTILFFQLFSFKADEGMWLPMLLGEATYKNMVECGIRLTPEQIYDANNSSLKDAIVALGGGFCTGEIISNQGLMMTNHHCGFATIQANSTIENDYLTDGFWAMTKQQEIPADFGVWFLNNISDVTDKVLKGLKEDMTEKERDKLIRANSNALKNSAKEGKNKEDFAVQVKSFYYGNLYYMFTYSIYNDVRLVGAPPSSIGKFGGDTDNWMWPRHTGDFTIFRVYADKENNPASYSEENQPLKPKHSLPVSIAGVQEGDYAMIMGYPGRTDRFLTSWGVKEAVEIEQPARVKIRKIKLDIMDEQMSKSQKVRIQYASKYARVSNYWKYFVGQSEQLVKNKVFDKKRSIENSFSLWYQKNKLDKTYSEVLPLIENATKSSSKYTIPKVYFQEAVVGSELILFMLRNLGPKTPIYEALKSGEGIKKAKENLIAKAVAYYKDYNAVIDENTLASVLSLYANDVDKEFQPELLISLKEKYKGDFKRFAKNYFKKTHFKSLDLFKSWVNNDKFSIKTIEKDLVYQLKNEFLNVYRYKVMVPKSSFDSDYNKGMRLFVDGLQKMGMNKASDANSTMRFTYGNILSYSNFNDKKFDFYTTLDGLMEKEVVTDDKIHEFYVPQKLKDLYDSKDFGPYVRREDGKLPVNFLSNNDITGGNSGSPVINSHGELIGTAFDGNWEAMSGDIFFEPNIQRTISVDIRYSLFIIDKYAGAKHLIDEMEIIENRHEEVRDSKNKITISKAPPKPANVRIVEGSVKFVDQNQNNAIDANEQCSIQFTIENSGIGEGMAMNLVTEKVYGNDLRFNHSIALGNLNPGSSKSIKLPIQAGMNTNDGKAHFKFLVNEIHGFGSNAYEIDIPVKSFVEPKLEVVDYKVTSQAGKIVKKEDFDLELVVQNIGQGTAKNVKVNLIIPQNIFVMDGEINITIPIMEAGDSKVITCQMIANNNYNSNEINIKANLSESYGKYAKDQNIVIKMDEVVSSNKLSLTAKEQQKKEIEQVSLSSDVDKNIPVSNVKENNRIALIIGNEDYSKSINAEINVDYAVNDATVFKKYANNVLGVKEENTFFITNASSGIMQKQIDLVAKLAKNMGSSSEIIFYYAGHGVPDEITKEPYIIPVDVDATNLSAAIKLKNLYAKLSESNSKRVTVFLDACFSGGARNMPLLAARGVRINPKEETISGNIVVFSATSEKQSALSFDREKHGMFTYFLLKKLQESSGKANYGELKEYINSKVSVESLRTNHKEQNPQVNISPVVKEVWRNWKF